MHYSSTWLILKNKKFDNVISSTRSHRSGGRQSTQKLRKLQLQCGFLSLKRVGGHDRLKFLEPFSDCRHIHTKRRRSCKLGSGRCPACLTVVCIGIVGIKAGWTVAGGLPWTQPKDKIRWALANTADSPKIPLKFSWERMLTGLRGEKQNAILVFPSQKDLINSN